MDKYGLIGFPLGHSFSISYFNEKFANEGIKARYINYEIPQIEDLKEILASNPELRGLTPIPSILSALKCFLIAFTPVPLEIPFDTISITFVF